LLLPIAGDGIRFVKEGYEIPKPLIKIEDDFLVQKSLRSIDLEDCNLIFVVKKDHIENNQIDTKLIELYGNQIKIIATDTKTGGALSSCLLANNEINNDIPLLIFTPDCYFEPKIIPSNIDSTLDGLVCVFESSSDAHSYVKLNENNHVTQTAEKEVISNDAIGGFYYFKSGKLFVDYANKLIDRKLTTKGEYYIAPVYNLLINDEYKIGIDRNTKHIILGTPADLERYLSAS
jgi:choline kinase